MTGPDHKGAPAPDAGPAPANPAEPLAAATMSEGGADAGRRAVETIEEAEVLDGSPAPPADRDGTPAAGRRPDGGDPASPDAVVDPGAGAAAGGGAPSAVTAARDDAAASDRPEAGDAETPPPLVPADDGNPPDRAAAAAAAAQAAVAALAGRLTAVEGEVGALSQRKPDPARGIGGGAFLALVLGGIIAAGGGFALARWYPDLLPIATAPAPAADPALAARVAETATAAAALAERQAALEAAQAALAARIDAMPGPAAGGDPAALAPLADRLAALEAQVAALAARPSGEGASDGAGGGADPAALAAMAETVAALRAEVEGLRATVAAGPDPRLADQIAALTAAAAAERAAAEARAEALRLETERATAAMRARAALLRVQAAVDGGGPLDAALADLAAAGVAVPAELAAQAAGVPTLATLQAAFPDAARAALAASVTVPTDGDMMDRLGAFLRAQTGARSLEPRSGDDPDAVLSRAEAALRAGDLAATLAELDTLPPAAAPALAAWRAQAEARAAAVAAVRRIAAELGAE